METIKVILEKTQSGYSVYSDDIPGCIAVGEDLLKAKQNIISAIKAHAEAHIEFGEELPLKLQNYNDLEYEFFEIP